MTHGLKIGKKTFPFKFGIRAWKEYAVNFQSSNGNELDLENLDDIKMIYLGLKHGAIKEGKKFTLTLDEVEDLLDDDFEAYTRGVNLITAALPKQEGNEVRP